MGLWGVKVGAPPCPGASTHQGGREAVLSPLLWRLAPKPQTGAVWAWGGTGLAVRCSSDLGNLEVWGDFGAEGVGVAEA